MKVNLGITALNTNDWDRFEAQDWSRPPVVPDHYIWDRLVEMGDTQRLFTSPGEQRTEAYITGRFG